MVDINNLVDVLQTDNLVINAGLLTGAVKFFVQPFEQGFQNQRRLASAGDAGHTGECSQRNFQLNVFQIIGAGAFDADKFAVALAALGRNFNLPGTVQILGRQTVRIMQNFFHRTLGRNKTALLAGAGPHVNQIIGGTDGVFIVFNHNNRIADVPQPGQRFQQPVVVALVQTDGRLVQNIHDPGQSRTDLRGQTNALRFAAGKRARLAGQGQIIQPHIV